MFSYVFSFPNDRHSQRGRQGSYPAVRPGWRRVVDPASDTEIRGLPIGPYRVDATLVGSDGSRLALNVSGDDYGQFRPAMGLDRTGDGTCTLNSGVDWQYLYLEFPR